MRRGWCGGDSHDHRDGRRCPGDIRDHRENPDRAALVALYEATTDRTGSNEGWLTDAPLGEWYGVDTNGPGRVIRLDLGGRWDSERRWTYPMA